MTDKDNKVVNIAQAMFKQLSLGLDIPELTQSTSEVRETIEAPSETTPEQTALQVPAESFNVMPNTLKAAAESSMTLRNTQATLANILTSDVYLATLVATAPDVLPSLMDSVTNAVSSADNLLIKMAQVSEKSASMQRAFDYLIKQKEQLSDAKAAITQKDEYYDESVERIKAAIYRDLDAKRDANPRTAQDYVDENDVKAHGVIDAEYTTVEDNEQSISDDFDDIPEE